MSKQIRPEAQNIDAADGSPWQVRIGRETVTGEDKYRVQFSLKKRSQPDGKDMSCCLVEWELLADGLTQSHYDGVGVMGKHRDLNLRRLDTDRTAVDHEYPNSSSGEWGKGRVPVNTKRLKDLVKEYVDWIRVEPNRR